MNTIGALFDLDGVLIDSETTYTRFWEEIDRMYPTGIENYAITIKGTTLPEILKHYDSDEVIADIVRRVIEFQENLTFNLYDGVAEFLTDLRLNSIRTAIVTSSDNRKMQLLFSQIPLLKELVDVVIDASMVEHSKPNPEGYLKAAAAIGCNPENCYVFEDSLQGLKAGTDSGATVIALSTTYPQETLKGKAAKIIDGFVGFSVKEMLSINKL